MATIRPCFCRTFWSDMEVCTYHSASPTHHGNASRQLETLCYLLVYTSLRHWGNDQVFWRVGSASSRPFAIHRRFSFFDWGKFCGVMLPYWFQVFIYAILVWIPMKPGYSYVKDP